MFTAIHIELDALCLLLLSTIAYQSHRSLNQKKDRILFRTTAYGIIILLALDILWVLIEGRVFPGAIAANLAINALYLGGGVVVACLWYFYVLENLGHAITRRLQMLVMLPGVVFMLLNIASIWTGWFFTVSPENVYRHGRMYWLQIVGAYGMIAVSFIHIIVSLIVNRNSAILRRDTRKLLKFYLVPVIGSIVSLFRTGMPGTWTCGAISIVLIYMDDQNRDVLQGMITAMAADYRSIYHANLDTDECVCVRATEKLFADKMWEGRSFSFVNGFTEYAEHCVAESDRGEFLRFVDPANIRAGLANGAMISHRYLTNKGGVEQYEMLRIAGVRFVQDREDHKVHAIGAGFSDVDRETRASMAQNRALAEALTRAEEASAAKTAFLSAMSHEIRTPMNAIIGLDNIALRDPNISPQTRDELEKIGSSARHLLALINDILDMNRIESGRMELRSEAFSFREMLDQIAVIVDGQCKDKGLRFACDRVAPLDEYFVGDDLRLKQVIINILGNAVKFTDAPGTVSFIVAQENLSQERAMLRFVMKDTGIGMDPAFIPRLFDAFSQEDATSTNRYGGSGLGMAITKNIVDLMGGTVGVESEKGVGTTFTVRVPLRRTQYAADIAARDDAPTAPIEGLHVLIAEDMALNAEVLIDLLEMENITSEWAQNGQMAVEMFSQSAEGRFDAILMDMRMPVMDGPTATRAIRSLQRADAGSVPIIALTANAFEEDVRLCLQAGMDAHLSKPVDIDKLKKLLGGMLSARDYGSVKK